MLQDPWKHLVYQLVTENKLFPGELEKDYSFQFPETECSADSQEIDFDSEEIPHGTVQSFNSEEINIDD